MTCYIGKAGIVKIGSDNVGEVTNFSVEETADTVECTAMGDDYRTYMSTFKAWTGSMEVHWDPDDSGQTAVVVGSSVTVTFYPEGDDTGDTTIGGTAIVTGLTRTTPYDGIVTSSITFQGSGALTVGAVT